MAVLVVSERERESDGEKEEVAGRLDAVSAPRVTDGCPFR